ncbi:MAG: 50S ribosomal protein L1 [Candidatus Diapherotrites archaeon]|nr:50S ribosomal protein L1 [Candidatus Diapherotrites archaeon]
MVKKEEIAQAIVKAKESEKKRKFSQSVDLIVNLRKMEFKDPSKRFNLELTLPKGLGKNKKGALFAKRIMADEAAGKIDKIIREEELEKLSKKEIKKLAEEYDFFLADVTLMTVIGKKMGTILGPRRKMPKPLPDVKALPVILPKLKNTVLISNIRNGELVLHASIGTEAMSDEDLVTNAMTILNAIIAKIPSEKENIRSMIIKTTMGKPVKIEVAA